MRLVFHPEIFIALPGLRITAVVARGLTAPTDAAAVDRAWVAGWESAQAAREHGNAQFHPRVAPWRQAFLALGVSGKKFPTSIEALLRRAMKGGEPFRIHALVDFYNGVSLTHMLPAGGYDLAEIDGDLEVRLTRDGDTFRALDQSEPEPVSPGELAYTCGDDVLTRQLVWRQSERALIRPGTRDAVLVAEAVDGVPDEALDAVESDLRRGLEEWFGATTTTHRLDANRPAVDL